MIKKILSLLLLVFAFCATAQDRDHLSEAEAAFKRGEYESAINCYKLYNSFTGNNVDSQIEKAEKCRQLMSDALQQAASGNYDEAINLYSQVNALNPSDPNVIPRIEDAQRLKKETTTYKIGDLYNGYRICYVDETGQHGFLLTAAADNEVYFHTQLTGELPAGSRIPSVNELEMIFPIAKKVGLYNDRYWSSSTQSYTHNDRDVMGRYYLDFTTGKRTVGKRSDTAYFFWIATF